MGKPYVIEVRGSEVVVLISRAVAAPSKAPKPIVIVETTGEAAS